MKLRRDFFPRYASWEGEAPAEPSAVEGRLGGSLALPECEIGARQGAIQPLRQFFRLLLLSYVALGTNSLRAAGIDVIASTGTPSPTGNGTLSLFNAPTLSASGQAMFLAQLTSTAGGTSDNLGLYRRDGGALTQIIRNGTSTLGGVNVSTFFPAPSWIDAAGTVVSIVGVATTPVQTHMALAAGGPLSYVVAPGSASPTGGNTLLGVQSATVNDAGDAVFNAIYTGGVPEIGLYLRAANGAVTTKLLRNSTSPRGGTFTSVSRGVLNESGQVATLASVDFGTGAVSTAVRIDGTTVVELARQGDLTTDALTTLGGIFTTPFINDNGQLAFVANYKQPSVDRRGVFLADDAGLRLVAPDILLGSTFAVSESRVFGISSAGNVGYYAEMGGGIDPPSGIYNIGTSGPTLIALEDTAIPSGGKFFRRFLTDGLAYSDNGHIAFLAELSNTVNGAAAGRGLFFYDAEHGLLEVVKTGDALLGSTITNAGVLFNTSLGVSSLQTPDTSLSGLNKLGQVGFGFGLANGQAGVAIWSAAPTIVAGDFNEDGTVDAADLGAWSDNFGDSGAAMHTDGDADGDLDVDGADFLVWQQQLGAGDVLASAVPEPALSGLLIASTAIHGLARRIRPSRPAAL